MTVSGRSSNPLRLRNVEAVDGSWHTKWVQYENLITIEFPRGLSDAKAGGIGGYIEESITSRNWIIKTRSFDAVNDHNLADADGKMYQTVLHVGTDSGTPADSTELMKASKPYSDYKTQQKHIMVRLTDAIVKAEIRETIDISAGRLQ